MITCLIIFIMRHTKSMHPNYFLICAILVLTNIYTALT